MAAPIKLVAAAAVAAWFQRLGEQLEGSWLMHLHSPCWMAALRLAQHMYSLDQPELQSLHEIRHNAIAKSTTLKSLLCKQKQDKYVVLCMRPLHGRNG